jgi:hypothetical protein
MVNAPIHIHGWDETTHYWRATRRGEPSFEGVQDLEDAYAAALNRSCEIVVADDVWIEMNDGLSPIRPSDVLWPG